jgi:hypothetical protein
MSRSASLARYYSRKQLLPVAKAVHQGGQFRRQLSCDS